MFFIVKDRYCRKTAKDLSKHKLYEQHIEHRSHRYGEYRIFSPQMNKDYRADRQKLGKSVREDEQTCALKTVHHKHCEYCRGKRLAEILYVLWRRSF